MYIIKKRKYKRISNLQKLINPFPYKYPPLQKKMSIDHIYRATLLTSATVLESKWYHAFKKKQFIIPIEILNNHISNTCIWLSSYMYYMNHLFHMIFFSRIFMRKSGFPIWKMTVTSSRYTRNVNTLSCNLPVQIHVKLWFAEPLLFCSYFAVNRAFLFFNYLGLHWMQKKKNQQ